MDIIKEHIKRSRLFQYKKCIEYYSSKRIRLLGESKNKAILKTIRDLRIIYKRNNTIVDRLDQIEKTLHGLKIEINIKNGFLYFLDENIIMYSRNEVIDNVPFNYEIFINSGLNELQQYINIRNEIDEENARILNIVSEFIDKICIQTKKDDTYSEHEKEAVIHHFRAMKMKPAEDLNDAIQRILFWNQILWQTGHKLIGLGRLDKILNRFKIDNNTEKTLSSFLKILHEHYYFKSNAMLGDTGQIIVLGGLDETGSYFCNDYTNLFLKCLTELSIPDPKIILRVSNNMPDELLQLACDCILTGCGSPLLSNDEIVPKTLIEFGYKVKDGYNYGVSACWEPLSIGNSLEQNNLFNIEYARVFSEMILSSSIYGIDSYDEFLNLYFNQLLKHINLLRNRLDSLNWEKDPLFTVSMDCCKHNNKDVSDGGAEYNNYGLLSVGMAATVNSLINIKKYVFEDQKYNLSDIKSCLIENYVNNQNMKDDFADNAQVFGECEQEVVQLTQLIMNKTEEYLYDYKNKFGGKVKFGLSSPGYVNLGKNVGTTADGRLSGMPFSTHISREKNCTLTEIMLFAGSLDYSNCKSNGNVVDLIIPPALIQSGKLVEYIKAAISIGFFQSQFNIITYQQLIDARKNPEKHPNLIVRVWGFSAYFKELPIEYQDVLIERARIAELA